jgi:hypothetical protein
MVSQQSFQCSQAIRKSRPILHSPALFQSPFLHEQREGEGHAGGLTALFAVRLG